MKALILTVTAGFGHHATANALKELFLKRGAEVKVVDVYEYLNRLVHDTISKGYLFSTKYTPELYRIFYTLTENKDQDDFLFNRLNIIQAVNALGSVKFEKIILDFEPDAIVCTHIFAAQLINEMKKRNLVSAPTVGIVTDYTLHPFWEDVDRVEYLVIASELITHLAQKKGIASARILPFGIPIHPKFSRKIEREDACAQLGLDPSRSVVLVMGGSMGYGNNKKVVEQINSVGIDFQILAVCGNNKRQYKKLMEYKAHYQGSCSLYPFGFADNVEVLMSAADCIITKPGGLTVSEAISKGLPMILVDPIPGQEERNVEFLLNNGIASLVTKTFPLDEAMYHLFMNPVRLRTVHETIEAIGHPDASERLVDFILALKKKL